MYKVRNILRALCIRLPLSGKRETCLSACTMFYRHSVIAGTRARDSTCVCDKTITANVLFTLSVRKGRPSFRLCPLTFYIAPAKAKKV